MSQSLHSFCKFNGLSKTSVHRYLTDEGFDLSQGMSKDAIAAACAYFLVETDTAPTPAAEDIPTSPQPDSAAQPVEVTIETGNHCTSLARPEMAAAFSLERFRADDVTALAFDDPGAVADEFLAVAEQIEAAMDADVKARQQRLEATKAAQAKVAAKAQELSLEARLYRLQAGQLDTAQTAETQALQDAVAALQSMGKTPTEGAA